MDKIQILNLRHTKPVNPWDVKVDRSSVLGNPFVMETEAERDEVCERYSKYFEIMMQNKSAAWEEINNLCNVYLKHKQLNLFCWCAPKKCHAETIRAEILSRLQLRTIPIETDKFKVIIAGSREFLDYKLLIEKCDHYLQNQNNIEVVSGAAKGADTLGERYAVKKGYALKTFPANWDFYGKSAGYRRNEEMAEYADALILFWDGMSKGSKHMLDTAREKNLKIKIVYY